jgi:hypothetical protein
MEQYFIAPHNKVGLFEAICSVQFGLWQIKVRPTPVAARLKAWVCGRSVAGIAGSNLLLVLLEESYRVWCV